MFKPELKSVRLWYIYGNPTSQAEIPPVPQGEPIYFKKTMEGSCVTG